MHRDSAGNGHAIYRVCAAVEPVECAAVYFGGDFVLYGLAGGVAISRIAAEFFGASIEERPGGVVDGFGVVWIVAHYEYGISELEVCDFGDDCGDILWVDVEEERVDFCVGASACRSGCGVAFFVSDGLRAALAWPKPRAHREATQQSCSHATALVGEF
jgi:hypothetical protein